MPTKSFGQFLLLKGGLGWVQRSPSNFCRLYLVQFSLRSFALLVVTPAGNRQNLRQSFSLMRGGTRNWKKYTQLKVENGRFLTPSTSSWKAKSSAKPSSILSILSVVKRTQTEQVLLVSTRCTYVLRHLCFVDKSLKTTNVSQCCINRSQLSSCLDSTNCSKVVGKNVTKLKSEQGRRERSEVCHREKAHCLPSLRKFLELAQFAHDTQHLR